MEALDILEKRIDALSRVLGPIESAAAVGETGKPNNTVVDSLISVSGMLEGALKGKEQINKSIERAPELEKYLDPDYLDKHQQVKAKEVYLNAVAPSLEQQFEQLELIKKMEPTLGAEYFRNIPGECSDKLKQVAADNVEFAQQNELIEESLVLAMNRYGDIQAGLLKKLDEMKKRLEVVEEKIENSKRSAREKAIE